MHFVGAQRAAPLSKLENSSSGQRGSAAPLCGKPLAFRPKPPISLSQRRLEGTAFQTALRRLVNVQAPRKGEAFPHSGAAEPPVSPPRSSVIWASLARPTRYRSLYLQGQACAGHRRPRISARRPPCQVGMRAGTEHGAIIRYRLIQVTEKDPEKAVPHFILSG